MLRHLDRLGLGILYSGITPAIALATALGGGVLVLSAGVAFAQDADTSGDDPVIEGDDGVVIPDDGSAVEETEDTDVPVKAEVLDEDEPVEVVEIEISTAPAGPSAAELAIEAKLMEEAMAQALLDAADAAAAAGKWREAAAKYLEANSFIPNHPAVIQGLQRAYSMLDQGPLLDRVQARRNMQREAARARFDSLLTEARNRLAREDFAESRRRAEAALSRLDRDDRSLFSEVEYQQRRRSVTTLLNTIARDTDAWQQLRIQEEAVEEEQSRRDREMQEGRKRDRLISENLQRVRQLQLEQRYEEAIDVVSEILFIDEHNAAALALRDAMKATLMYRTYNTYQEQREYGFAKLATETQGALVPPQPNMRGPGARSTTGVMSYPEEWEELTNRRYGADGFRDSVANRRIHVALEQPIGHILEYGEEGFENVLLDFEDMTGLTIFPDWQALADAGVDRRTPVTIRLGNIPIQTALSRVMDSVSSRDNPVAFEVQDG
ncbi:MAG: hypothetical protein QGH76_03775, partial [Phycisphaerales bacterium]|nr:hypothetical protein [Phycisphaerales bacterium]